MGRLLKEPYGGGVLRAFELAEYFWDRGECFRDPSCIRPGDLVFYQPAARSRHIYQEFGVFACISHIGIVTENVFYMYDAHGFLDKTVERSTGEDAVGRRLLTGDRTPVFYARPAYGDRQGEEKTDQNESIIGQV